MSVIKSQPTNYLLPKDFIGKEKCKMHEGEIYLESLEIYQIIAF